MKTLDEMECANCGAVHGYHRASDSLCPGKYPDGTVWRGQWEGSTTHFEMSNEDRARRMLAKMIARSETTKILVASQPEKFNITREEVLKLRAEILAVYPNLAWVFEPETREATGRELIKEMKDRIGRELLGDDYTP